MQNQRRTAKKSHKLAIHRETVRCLGRDDLRAIAGGHDTSAFHCPPVIIIRLEK